MPKKKTFYSNLLEIHYTNTNLNGKQIYWNYNKSLTKTLNFFLQLKIWDNFC